MSNCNLYCSFVASFVELSSDILKKTQLYPQLRVAEQHEFSLTGCSQRVGNSNPIKNTTSVKQYKLYTALVDEVCIWGNSA